MSLQQSIESALKDALRSGDETRKTALRLVIAGIKNAKVEKRAELTDEEVQSIVSKEVKSQREAIADAQKAARPALVAEAENLIAAMETFLPKQLSRAEIAAEVQAVMAEIGASSPGDVGKVMRVLQPKLKGLADGKLISEVVKELLSGK